MSDTNFLSRLEPVVPAKCYRLLNTGPTVLVTSAHAGRRNVMAAAWNMALDFDPPKVCVVIDKNTLTRELVEASGEFTLGVPARQIARETLAVGSASGREVEGDKLAHFGLRALPGGRLAAPLVDGCIGWLECRVIPEPHNQNRYDLFIGEVVAAWADPRVFRDGHWQVDASTAPALRTLHYVAGGHFFALGEAFEVPDAAR
jgi:flavin reductase (DIM6/NTAB) family NADH-FMN oxidoreductase RutF